MINWFNYSLAYAKHTVILCVGMCSFQSLAVNQYHFENVLGTSMDITIYGAKDDRINPALAKLTEDIEALEGVLSTWQKNSIISRLNTYSSIEQQPKALTEVLQLCEQWHQQSSGKFSCRMGKIRQLWLQAQKTQNVPDRVAMRGLAREIQRLENPLSMHNQRLQLTANVQVDPAGLAKGYIIDSAMDTLRKLVPEATGIKLDIGGDILLWGLPDNQSSWQVGLANYGASADRRPNHHIELANLAVAASGHTSRFYEIDRRQFSHILDPDEGWPMDHAPSAIVVAQDATTADAVATALSTQDVQKGIDWVNSLEGVEALVQTADIAVTSDGWHQFVPNSTQTQRVIKSEDNLYIEYQIPNINTAKYHRPYVALWISDSNNNNIRQLLLLGESERWAKENNRWWRKVGRKSPALLDAVARPTRLPGTYHLVWNGLDNLGRSVKPGEYVLHIEAAREGGGHDYQKVIIDTSKHINAVHLQPKGELGLISISQIDDSTLSAYLK